MLPLLCTRLLALSLLAPAPQGGQVEAYSRAYGPKATMLVARPTLRWEVWPSDGGRITSLTMLVNGKAVEATYSPDDKSLRYTPAKPLEPGTYRVECKVVVNGSLEARKTWLFHVSPDARSELAPPSKAQLAALDAANRLRRLLKLPDFEMDDRLNAAAQGHSSYLAKHGLTGHGEREGSDGFIGATPWERLEIFGFSEDCWEGVDSGSATPEIGVQRLIDAPYHRIPFLQPGKVLIGAGFADRRLAINFGGSKAKQTVVHPAPDQENVPTSWDANERPNPLRMHTGAKLPVGYPIVFTHWEDGCRITVSAATLREVSSGATVQVLLNTPQNDAELSNAAFVIPKAPLKQGEWYEVSVRAHSVREIDGAEIEVSRRWRFKTSG